MTSYCFNLHAKLLPVHSMTNQYSLTSLLQWSHWLSAMIEAMVFKGCNTHLHSTSGATNSTVSPLQHTAASTQTLEAGQSGASTKYALRFPSSNRASLLHYCRNVRPTWVKFNSKDTKESEWCSRF